jgi:thiamine biosynthesis protein ThiS
MLSQVNSLQRQVPAGTTVATLIASLDLPATRVAVEVNRSLVRRADHVNTRLHEHDVVEVVTLVGGG